MTEAAEAFWQRFLIQQAQKAPKRRRPPRDDEQYVPRPVYRALPAEPECVLCPGENARESNEILQRILSGQQTAFLASTQEIREMGGCVPMQGGYRLITNQEGTMLCAIRSKATELVPFRHITWAMAQQTGEARHLAAWMEKARRRELDKAAREKRSFNLDTPFLFDLFEVRYWQRTDEPDPADELEAWSAWLNMANEPEENKTNEQALDTGLQPEDDLDAWRAWADAVTNDEEN